jgi:hypothetical protein
MAPTMKNKDTQLYLDVAEVMSSSECDPKSIKYMQSLSREEVLAITPMTLMEEAAAVFLFTFGVPGAAYSVCCSVVWCSVVWCSV